MPSSKTKPATGKAASRLIDERIRSLGDWRGRTLAEVRSLIHEADPDIIEEWKWEVPVWSRDGIICTGETYKQAVKLTFARGASLDDPHGLFNSTLKGNTRRAIDIREGDALDRKAFKALIRAAVAENVRASAARSGSGSGTKGGSASKANSGSRTRSGTKARPGTQGSPAANARPVAKAKSGGSGARAQPAAGAPSSTTNKGQKVVLLSGGNPQIAKGDGDAPVHAYIAAMPGWKRGIGERLDALIVEAVPNVRKAVRWNSPFYGIEGQGWFVTFHVFTHYVKVTFFRGADLRPVPPGSGKDKNARWIDIREDGFDEAQMTAWVQQAAALPGWIP